MNQQVKITSPFGFRTTAIEVVKGIDLTGKTIIVTGGSSGLGLETVRGLVRTGATVVNATRDCAKAEQVAAAQRTEYPAAKIEYGEVDLGSLASIKKFTEAFVASGRPLHVLVLNAGVAYTPPQKTQDGFEVQFGTNFIGHFALLQGLLPALKKANGARVVCVSSLGHVRADIDLEDPNGWNKEYDRILAYDHSKTAIGLIAVGVTELYGKDKIFGNSLHPGGIYPTGLQKHMSEEDVRKRGWIDENGKPSPHFKTMEQGAATSCWVATAPQLEGIGGMYFEDCGPTEMLEGEGHPTWTGKGVPRGYKQYVVDPVRAKKLWAKGLEWIANPPSGKA